MYTVHPCWAPYLNDVLLGGDDLRLEVAEAEEGAGHVEGHVELRRHPRDVQLKVPGLILGSDFEKYVEVCYVIGYSKFYLMS